MKTYTLNDWTEITENGYGVPANDAEADKMVEEWLATKAEFDRMKETAEKKIEEITNRLEMYEEKYQKRAELLQFALKSYLGGVQMKETKTQRSYQFFSGKVVIKKPRKKLNADKAALVEWMMNNDLEEYITLNPAPAWAEYKKRVDIVKGVPVDKETGLIVCGVTIEVVPESVEVKA